MLTIDTIPLFRSWIWNVDRKDRFRSAFWSISAIRDLFIFLVRRMTTAATAEFFKLKPVRRVLFILGRYVVTLFALGALQNYIVSRHFLIPLKISYSTISETVPAPTVRPPSRIAKRSPFSMAIGAISSISIWMLSPGMTISTPAGRCATPVTSVVLK